MVSSDKLEHRLEELLDEMAITEKGSEDYKALAVQFKLLNAAAAETFKAESDDINNNNRNRAEMVKAVCDAVAKIATAGIGGGVTIYLSKQIVNFEEFGAITSKAFQLIPKWKF